MTERSQNLVDELGRLAAGAEPASLDESGARRLIERAMLAPAVPAPERTAFGWMLATAVIACAAIALWIYPRVPARSEPELSRVVLPTGDRVVGMAGAQFDLDRLEPADRRIRLRRGTILLNVAHVAAKQQLSVATEHLVALARGTVFSVETDAARSRVRVYEGVVEVTQAGQHHLLAAGGTWDSGEQTIAVAIDRPPALSAAVTEMLEERRARPVVIAPAPIENDVPDRIAALPDVRNGDVPHFLKPAKAVASRNAEIDHEPLDRLLASARADLAAGQLDRALETVKRAKSRGELSGEWWLVAGDALRGLGRIAEAADAFDVAASHLEGAAAIEAAYSASYLRFKDLRDPDAALASLVATVDAEGSPLEERGLGLRAQILEKLGRHDEAKTVAERYLARFPHADLRALMLALSTQH